MAEILITSFFTRGGVPATDIETATVGFPIVRVWEVIDGTPLGDSFIGEFVMSAIEDGVNDDGFYKYEFTTADGYDPVNKYLIRADGGTSVPSADRYQTAEINPADSIGAISDGVWDETRLDHLAPGSTGEALNQIKAETTDIIDKLYLDTDSVLEVVQLLLKLEAGRTRIDSTANTLTIFDEDCATPLRVFDLLDSAGNPSVTEVCERKPTLKGPSDTTTITDVCP